MPACTLKYISDSLEIYVDIAQRSCGSGARAPSCRPHRGADQVETEKL